MFEQNSTQENNRSAAGRSRSRSPPARRSRSRSRSPREWKRARRDSTHGRSSGGKGRGGPDEKVRLYVSNIPYEVRWQDLKDIFKKQCPDGITYVEMYEGPDGKTCGAGVVEVRGREAADKAIESMHRFEYKGRQIVVREERDKDRMRHMKPGAGDMGSGGGGGGSGPGIMGSMSNMGQGILGNMGGGNMGGGNMGGGNMGGGGGGGSGNLSVGNLNLNLSVLNSLGIDPANITDQVFVANLDYKVTARKLKDIFKMAGVIINCDIKLDKEGKSRGMGIVKFDHPMEAVQAVSMFNGQVLYDRLMSVRMDKMPDTSSYQPQQVPNKLPQGLKGVGMGLGISGAPLQDIGRIANCLAISTLHNIIYGGGNSSGNSSMGMSNMGNNMMGGNMGGMGGNMNMDNMGGGMGGNMGGMGNMGMGNSGMGNMGNSGMGNMGMGGSGMGNMGGGMGGNMGSGNMGSGNMGGNLGMGGMNSSNMGGMGNMGGGSGLSSTAMNLLGNQLGSLDRMNQLSNLDSLGSLGNSIMGGSSLSQRSGGGGGGGGGSGRSSQDTVSVVVRNLPYSYTWQNLKDKFQDCGDVRFTEIKMENGKSKGWGTVRFMNSEDARRAVNLMNGARIEGRMIDVRLDK